MLLTLVGAAVITIVGIKRDCGIKGSVLGSIFAVLSDFCSGAMNIGFSYSKAISADFIEPGYSQKIFDSAELVANLDKNAVAVNRSIYDHIIYDSSSIIIKITIKLMIKV